MKVILCLMMMMFQPDYTHNFLMHPFRWTNSPDSESMLHTTRGLWADCASGPGQPAWCGCVGRFDRDGDGDVDLFDRAAMEQWITSSWHTTRVYAPELRWVLESSIIGR